MATERQDPPAERAEFDPLLAAVGAELAARQNGVLSTAQLMQAGLGSSTISRWATSGLLHRLYPGVYAFGHRRLRPEGLQMAAVLAGGPDSTLSHRSALLARGQRRDAGATFEITTPGRRGRTIRGIKAYHHPLHADDRTTLHGVPITSVARTLVDAAGVVNLGELPQLLQRTLDLGLLDRRALDAAIERAKGRRGVGGLRAALADLDPDPAFVRSDFERDVRRLLRREGLPLPDSNPWVHIGEVDLVWATHRVALELDGWDTHRGRLAFERDRERGLLLEARGYRVLRASWRQFSREPQTILAALATVLAK
jgi:very-short-patch-repair endonuclease